MGKVVAVILGGGRGERLRPLTSARSKPAVPIAGMFRLVDVPISNCLNSDVHDIFVLTQYLSASLNRHIAQTYRMDHFSAGFVEVLAAEQTPEGEQWFQGTADAVRRAARHFREVETDYYLILAGDHVYRMDFAALIDTHVERLANRLGFVEIEGAVKIERALMERIPKARWILFAHQLILHGRQTCTALRPKCEACALAPDCPSREVA